MNHNNQYLPPKTAVLVYSSIWILSFVCIVLSLKHKLELECYCSTDCFTNHAAPDDGLPNPVFYPVWTQCMFAFTVKTSDG